jgi:hypothetical protein
VISNAYTNDKHYEKVKLKNVIVYGDRNKASRERSV